MRKFCTAQSAVRITLGPNCDLCAALTAVFSSGRISSASQELIPWSVKARQWAQLCFISRQFAAAETVVANRVWTSCANVTCFGRAASGGGHLPQRGRQRDILSRGDVLGDDALAEHASFSRTPSTDPALSLLAPAVTPVLFMLRDLWTVLLLTFFIFFSVHPLFCLSFW